VRGALLAALTLLGCASRVPRPRALAAPADAAAPVAAAAPGPDACGSPRPGAVCLPAGLSLLGAETTEDHFELRPARAARLRAFSLDRAEVAADRYRECVAAGRCAPMRCDADVPAGAPARCLAWADARAYCTFRGGRLPSEAEWQRAAAGPLDVSRPYPYGATAAAADAAVDDLTPEGIRDLAGSVAEWVDDPGNFYPALPELPRLDAAVDAAVDASLAELPPRTDAGLFIYDDPRGAVRGPWRVVRGGDARLPWGQCTSALRRMRLPTEALPWVGVRCAYDPESPSPATPTRPYS
jgi:formylglycine-generating enzyme required for sulfatase activity